MKTYIALFRGINVGGNNRLPMKELTARLEALGARNVKTYIQSGNAVFQHQEEDAAALSDQISAAIQESHGFEPWVLLLSQEEMERAIGANPFPEAESEPKSLHLFFLAAAPAEPELDMLDGVRRENERFQLLDRVFYLHAPDGIGRSKLAERVGRALDVQMTARNWRTVSKIMEMVK